MSDQEDRVAALSDDDRPDAAANEAASDAEDADVNNDELQAEMDDLFGDDAGEEAEESKYVDLDPETRRRCVINNCLQTANSRRL